jgi:hypothetical protein
MEVTDLGFTAEYNEKLKILTVFLDLGSRAEIWVSPDGIELDEAKRMFVYWCKGKFGL